MGKVVTEKSSFMDRSAPRDPPRPGGRIGGQGGRGHIQGGRVTLGDKGGSYDKESLMMDTC